MRRRLPVSVSSAVFIEDELGRLLLLQQASKKKGERWGPPAGGMKAHEDPFQVAKRETKEEINVEIELIDLLGIYSIDRGESKTGIGFVFRAKIIDGDIKPAPGEIKDYRFFTFDEIKDFMKHGLIYKPEYNKQCLRDWANDLHFPLGVVRSLISRS